MASRHIAGVEAAPDQRKQQEKPVLHDVRELIEPLYTSRQTLQTIAHPLSLPALIDDAEAQFGATIYDQMMTNPYCSAAVRYLMARIFGSGMSVMPAVQKPPPNATQQDISEYEKAVEIADYVKYLILSLEDTDAPFTETLICMAEALYSGHRIAEIVAKVKKGGPYDGKPVVDMLLPLPRENYSLVVDLHGRMLGILGQRAGTADIKISGSIPDVWKYPNFSYKSKLLHFAFSGKFRSPLGSSILRSAYRAWWTVEQAAPAELRGVIQAGGMTFAIIGSQAMMAQANWALPSGETYVGNGLKAAVEWGKELAAGRVAVFPPDAKLETLSSQRVAEAFDPFYARQNKAIVTAIMLTSRAIMESERNSMADAGGAENIQDELRNFLQQRICKMLDIQLIRPFVRLAYGEECMALCPNLTMQKTASPDLAASASAFAQFRANGGITNRMLPRVINELAGWEYEPDSDESEQESAEASKVSGVNNADES